MNVARRAPTIRRTLIKVTVLVAVLSMTTAGLMVTLATYLQRVTADMAASVQSVHLTEQMGIDLLLLHTRATDPILRRKYELGLQRKLADARRFATTSEELVLLEQAREQTEQYIAASRAPGISGGQLDKQETKAYAALERLSDINVAQSQRAYREAARWEAVASAHGVGSSALLLGLAAWMVWWLKAKAFPPVLALGRVMDRFAAGDRGARAIEVGPEELREMARRFNDMASALAAQRQAQITFLGGVAHDLRNPLSVLRMAAAIVERGGPLPPEQTVRRTLDMVSRQASRMERMLGDFLDMANIEAGRLDLRLQEQDACQLVRQVVELFEATSLEHALNVSTPGAAVTIRCDPMRIEQVVTNLISNAIKYSPKGGAVDISLRTLALEVIFEVHDHGIGIAEHDQRRLFEPFRRLGSSKEAVPGVGLGLFVVRRIVEAHGGRIDVVSALGEGSMFRVVLPRAARPEPPRG